MSRLPSRHRRQLAQEAPRKLDELTTAERAHLEDCTCGHRRAVHDDRTGHCLSRKCKCITFNLAAVQVERLNEI